MENSIAYRYLVDQISATGAQKLDGYYPKIMEEIFDWERDEVEEIIWNTFYKNSDTDLACFLPKLQKYDGIKALKEALLKCSVPSGDSLNIAKELYEQTNEIGYLDVFKKNIEMSSNKSPIVAMLIYLKPSDELYKIFIDIYIYEDNETVRDSAIIGILYNKKYIQDPHDVHEIIKKKNLLKLFDKNNADERRSMIKALENKELEQYLE